MKHWSLRAAILSIATLLALAAGPAFAQGKVMQQIEARFNAADKDHDGKLTKAEAKAGMPRVAQNFEKIDANNAGFITLAQIGAFVSAQKK
jgi:hypothetical protein